MGDLPRVRLNPSRPVHRPGLSALMGLAGGLLSVAALLVCAIVAVVFAATLAVIMVLASLLLALATLAWRLKSRPVLRGAAVRPRSGHAWVAYDWNRHPG